RAPPARRRARHEPPRALARRGHQEAHPGGVVSLLRSAPGERLRRLESRVFTGLCALSALVVLAPLASIVIYLVRRGLPGLSLSSFPRLLRPGGEPGGMGNAVLGSLELCALACLIGLPIGVGAGLYLAEVGRGRLASLVRFTADVLGGVPSITIGVFVY